MGLRNSKKHNMNTGKVNWIVPTAKQCANDKGFEARGKKAKEKSQMLSLHPQSSNL
jgi:hypothetical protein